MKDSADGAAILAVRDPDTGTLILDDIAAHLGATTVEARAQLWGMDWRTLYRLRAGGTPRQTTLAAVWTRLPDISRRLRDEAGHVMPRDLTIGDLFTATTTARAA